MRLGDLDDLKVHISELILVYSGTELDNAILNAIDNAPTVEPETKVVANVTFNKEQMEELVEKAKADILAQIERPQGECKSCRHRDPEDKKCDCSGMERQGCVFPVSDDYYCKYYERGEEE